MGYPYRWRHFRLTGKNSHWLSLLPKKGLFLADISEWWSVWGFLRCLVKRAWTWRTTFWGSIQGTTILRMKKDARFCGKGDWRPSFPATFSNNTLYTLISDSLNRWTYMILNKISPSHLELKCILGLEALRCYLTAFFIEILSEFLNIKDFFFFQLAESIVWYFVELIHRSTAHQSLSFLSRRSIKTVDQSSHKFFFALLTLSLIHIWRCRRLLTCRSRWSPYH